VFSVGLGCGTILLSEWMFFFFDRRDEMNDVANFFLMADFVAAGILMGIVVLVSVQQFFGVDEEEDE
jgi:hypothetical protein